MKKSGKKLAEGDSILEKVTPTAWIPRTGSGYTLREIEQRLESGEDPVNIEKEDLPTPCLLLDLDLLEANIRKMAQHAAATAIHLRPHAKSHKCPEIAKRQIDNGALGVSTATIYEAESMSSAGIQGLLVTSEMVGRNKIERLLRITSKQPDTLSVVDNSFHARELNEAAAAVGVTLNVLIDVDPGGRRTGIVPGDEAVALAEQIMKLGHLELQGIHAYAGVASHVEGFQARQIESKEAMRKPIETFLRLKKAGLPVKILSGASTGTYNIDSELEGITEFQVGSYVFMDVDYRRIGGKEGPLYEDFSPSLTVLSTVISKNYSDWATVDAGLKAFSTDRQFGPEIKGITGVEYQFMGDEHGGVILDNPSREIRLGDRLEFIVPHCDPNVNLYDHLVCLRGTRVEAIWRITGRGHG